MKHFEFFPKVEYCDNLIINIMVRGKIRDAILDQTALYYKYTVSDTDRPDVLAAKYYGNANHTWAIFYANEIFDPRFDWPLNNAQFYAYLKSKYGSVQKTQNLLDEPHHYLLDDLYVIDKTTYLDNTIEASRKKAVSIYDHEWNLNEAKREIKVLDVVYLRQITNELENLFKT